MAKARTRRGRAKSYPITKDVMISIECSTNMVEEESTNQKVMLSVVHSAFARNWLRKKVSSLLLCSVVLVQSAPAREATFNIAFSQID